MLCKIACMYVCMYVYMYIYIYIHICIYIIYVYRGADPAWTTCSCLHDLHKRPSRCNPRVTESGRDGLPGQSAKAVAAEAGAPYSRVAPETDAHGQGKTLPS